MKRTLLLFFALAAAIATARPVVFLHGWNSDSDIWETMSGLLVSDAGYAKTNILELSYYSSGNSDSSCTMATDIKDVAEFCAREIKEFYLAHGSEPVDIVCHSMGGLVARCMYEYGMLEPECFGRFIPIATPHFGVAIGAGYQANQMYHGSAFLWGLAERWQFLRKRIPETLCIAGINANGLSLMATTYGDGLVADWSAALGETPCRYVEKHHSSTWPDPIYECEKASDPVYKLVKAFLSDGSILEQSALGFAPPAKAASQGGVFLQVAKPGPAPDSYAGIKGLKRIARYFTNEATHASVTATVYHGQDSAGLSNGVELVAGTIPAGDWTVRVFSSSTTNSFSASGEPVIGERAAVVRIITSGKLQLKPQNVFFLY